MGARLITERDVTTGSIRDPLIIDAETVITPSALDAAYARGIRVVFARDRSTNTACAPRIPFAPLPEPPPPDTGAGAMKPVPTGGKDCGCACACGKSSPAAREASQRTARDWVDILEQRRKRGFDSAAFRP